jgi:hypothetical protein
MKLPRHSFFCIFALSLAAAAPLALAQDNSQPAPAPAPAPADSGSSADQAPAPAPKPKRGGSQQMLNRLKDKLSLTDDQVTKVQAILKAQMEAGQKIRDDDSLSDDDKRAKGRDLMKSTHDQIRALLTADQQKTFDAMPPMRGPRRPKPDSDSSSSGSNPPPAPPAN